MDITFYCGSCGQKIVLDEPHADAEVHCPSCGSMERAPAEMIPRHHTNPHLRLRGIGANAPALALGPPCPKCGAALATPEAIICLHCGINLETGKKLRTRTHAGAGRPLGSWLGWVVLGIMVAAAAVLFWFVTRTG